MNNKDKEFWKSEYCKHGTCAHPSLPTQYDYFLKTTLLHRQYDPTRKIKKLGIKNGSGIQSIFKEKIKLSCRNNYITEIRICLDQTSFKPIACESDNKCNDAILQ